MRCTIHACWASFCPNAATCGWITCSSFSTTVVTPRKWPGRLAPSKRADGPSTSTQAGGPAGYTSSGGGANTWSTPAATHRSVSRGRSRG